MDQQYKKTTTKNEKPIVVSFIFFFIHIFQTMLKCLVFFLLVRLFLIRFAPFCDSHNRMPINAWAWALSAYHRINNTCKDTQTYTQKMLIKMLFTNAQNVMRYGDNEIERKKNGRRKIKWNKVAMALWVLKWSTTST